MLRILPAIEPLFPHTPDSQLAEAESQLELVLHHAKSTVQRGHSETTLIKAIFFDLDLTRITPKSCHDHLAVGHATLQM